MIGIDLFAGAGGMSHGARLAGIEIREAVEIDGHASATYEANHSGVSLYRGDIKAYNPPELHARGESTIVFGGPPCQGFSTSNQRTRTQANPSNWLFRELLRVVEIVLPTWVVVENVIGILQTSGGAFVAEMRDGLEKLGYTVSQAVLDASRVGVPQRRSRLFMLGSRVGQRVDLTSVMNKEIVTVRDAISDLPALENGAEDDELSYTSPPMSAYAAEMRGDLQRCCGHTVTRNAPHIVERYRHIEQGANWQSIPAELMHNYKDPSKCHTGIYHRLSYDSPAKVIGNFRKNMLIHPLQSRGLSVREAARLQSFPDSYKFPGSIGFRQQQVGNAVPPLLARAVFNIIIQATRT
jgi:DNA (cytosine-5)-methyltransferase 1